MSAATTSSASRLCDTVRGFDAAANTGLAWRDRPFTPRTPPELPTELQRSLPSACNATPDSLNSEGECVPPVWESDLRPPCSVFPGLAFRTKKEQRNFAVRDLTSLPSIEYALRLAPILF